MADPTTTGGDHVTRDLPMLSVRAEVRPDTVNDERRTVDLVWTTGARVLRGFYEPWYEELSLDPKHVRLSRLNNGAPLLDSHRMNDGTAAVIGVVEAARLEKRRGVATVRFAKAEDDPEADRVFRKVKDGIIQNVSVGYRTYRLERVEGGEGKTPVFRATDWEPIEISVVPAGADDGAGTRSAAQSLPCVFVTHRESGAMEHENEIPAAPQAPAVPAATPNAEEASRAAAEAATRAERARAEGIREAGRALKLPTEIADKLVREGTSLESAREALIRARAEADSAVPTEQHVRVELGRNLKREATVEGIRNAILHRVAPTVHKLDEVGRQFRGMTLLEMARAHLEAAGVDTRGLSRMELAGAALGLRGSYHSASDYPIILADVANKTLRDAYTEAPQTYQAISRRTTLVDFKPVRRTQLGEAPQLKKVIEGGEFTRGTIGEGREQYQLATYGRVFAITRQALVNDDMDAFSRIPALFGRSARDLESDLVWEQITSNPAMGDGTALFHASHGNLAAAGAAIAVATIGAGRTAMRSQKGLDKKQFVNVQARYLVVPAALETVADQFVSTIAATQAGDVNPFAGRLTVVAEPRLDAASVIAWYLAADPSQIDMVEYAYLEGEDGPAVETRVGFEVDGMEIKCRHDFAAKVIDHRGFYRNAGA